MESKSWWWKTLVLCGCLALPLWGGTFGKVVSIGGNASDLALDEARGVLYIANFTANRIEVMSLSNSTIQTSINVAPQPGSIALSPDGKYLLVAHFGNFQSPATPSNALTVIDLGNGGKQQFALGNTPLGVAFGIDNRALIVTTQEFLLFDPLLGTTQTIDTVQGVGARPLPQPAATFPGSIVASSVAVSGDGLKIFGLCATGTGDNLVMEFIYDVTNRRVQATYITAAPPLGPRVISVNQDGSMHISGWAMLDSQGTLVAQFPNSNGVLNVGTHYIDSNRGVVYAQFQQAVVSSTTTGGSGSSGSTGSTGGSTGSGGTGSGTTTGGAAATTTTIPPLFQILDGDNFTIREQLYLAENTAGKSVMSSDGMLLYTISDSGVMLLPVGTLSSVSRVGATQEDMVFQGSYCDKSVATQQLTVVDSGGGNTAFSLSVSSTSSSTAASGITLSPTTGVTPATITVRVDPSVYLNQKGTASAQISITSAQAANVIKPVRVLINVHDPDQRGTSIDVPGTLVDLLADPIRDRFYILRQDKNQVLVYDGTSYSQIATLRTGNTPTQLAISFDRQYLLVGNDNSQIANVFDLNTLQPTPPIRFPFGHYPRSIASSGNATLGASRVAGPKHQISKVDWSTRTATVLPTLGVYTNDVNINTNLVATPNGSGILAVEADGNVLLYDANASTFTASRHDFTGLSGSYAASSYGQYIVSNALLNASLVPIKQLETASGNSSGFAFVDQTAYRTTAADTASPGIIQRVDLTTGQGIKPTRMVEAPRFGITGFVFTRSLAPLYNRNAMISLSTSGFTVVPWTYDASVASPRIDRVVNSADQTQPVAPGSLIQVTGANLSPINLATSQMPLPTALGDSCLTVNGVAVPMLFVSSTLMNAQLPFQVDGNVTMVLHTPGGVSDNFNLTILPAAPSVFRSGTAGPVTSLPTVYRDSNNEIVTPSNPIHRGDTIVIYLTGMGRTSPSVDAGIPAPTSPLSSAIIPPTVTVGGSALTILYAGLTPGQVGVYQINATVPRNAATGMTLPLTINQSGGSTSIDVRVVE